MGNKVYDLLCQAIVVIYILFSLFPLFFSIRPQQSSYDHSQFIGK